MSSINKIPLFDSLSHPMINGNWLHPKYDGKNTVELLLQQMAEHNVRWAFAVGMGDEIGGYREDGYADFIRRRADNLFPVAFLDFRKLEKYSSVIDYLSRLRELNYAGIKIHPRFARITYDHPLLAEIITVANQLGLTVLFCTYFWENTRRCSQNTIETLIDLLSLIQGQKIILLHGGTVRLLEMMEVARVFKHVLLDLSFTLCKYEGSSLDMDIRFLFRQFDLRICLGSDGPDFTPCDLRRRFEFFSDGLDKDKLENIAYKNLVNFTGLVNNETSTNR